MINAPAACAPPWLLFLKRHRRHPAARRVVNFNFGG
jgi:hypothetical protein